MTMLTEALEHLVKGIVDHPDDVSVQIRRGNPRYRNGGQTLVVRVHPEDLGRVIGRAGRTATALRTVLSALDGNKSVRIDFVDVDRQR